MHLDTFYPHESPLFADLQLAFSTDVFERTGPVEPVLQEDLQTCFPNTTFSMNLLKPEKETGQLEKLILGKSK